MTHNPPTSDRSTAVLWSHFRFSVIGPLLSAPPARGELKAALQELAAKTWTHPIHGRPVRFAVRTIERWYYKAKRERDDPVGVLRRAVRKDRGRVSLAPKLIERLLRQYSKRAHVASTRIRPVLLVDEAQEMSPQVLSELRILCSADFDATSLLTVVLCGDGRLLELLRHPDLIPLSTRIRARLQTEPASRDELLDLLRHALEKAGNASLMTPELMNALVDHSAGNCRLLMTLAGELLAHGIAREVGQLDEKFYFEVFQTRPSRLQAAPKKKARVRR